LSQETTEQDNTLWYFYALFGPAIWALLNHLDKYLLGRFFREDAAGPVLVVFTGLAGIIVAITIVLFGQAVFTHAPRQVFFVMGAGAFLVASYIPYMIAMQRDEASIVASLYRLAPVFVFVLSYVVLGETLRLKQIVGAVVTILGSILLIVDPLQSWRRIDLTTFGLMCAACLMNACTVIIFKSVALGASFWSSAFWEYIGSGIFSVTLIFSMPSYRRALFALLRSREACTLVPITVSGEALNLLANLAVGFAGLMAPLALVSIVTGLHPFFVLGYGMLFTRFLPAFGRERLTPHDIVQKIVAISVMCAGIVVTFAE
jgi:drug/metabolite transporter (DMT)-like permease